MSNEQHIAWGSELHLVHMHLEEFTTSNEVFISVLNFIPSTYRSLEEPERKTEIQGELLSSGHTVTCLKAYQFISKGIKGTFFLWSAAPHGVSSHKEQNICHKTLCSNLQESGWGPESARKLISLNHPLAPLLPPIQTVVNPTEVKTSMKVQPDHRTSVFLYIVLHTHTKETNKQTKKYSSNQTAPF